MRDRAERRRERWEQRERDAENKRRAAKRAADNPKPEPVGGMASFSAGPGTATKMYSVSTSYIPYATIITVTL